MKYKTLFFNNLDSTNDEAFRIAKKASNYSVLVAKTQSKGRGRYGRKWISQEGGLFFSILIKGLPIKVIPSLYSFIASLSLVKALEEIGVNATLKWPNDVLLNGKKLAGILLEYKEKILVVGVGVNIDSAPDLTTNLPATHIDIDKEIFLDKFLKQFSIYESSDIVIQKWKEYCPQIGKKITIRLQKHIKTHIFSDIDSCGNLITETGEKISSGEIFMLDN